jgi:hypothetical protein
MSIMPSDGPNGIVVEIDKKVINILGVGTSTEKFSSTLVAKKIFLCWRLFIPYLSV